MATPGLLWAPGGVFGSPLPNPMGPAIARSTEVACVCLKIRLELTIQYITYRSARRTRVGLDMLDMFHFHRLPHLSPTDARQLRMNHTLSSFPCVHEYRGVGGREGGRGQCCPPRPSQVPPFSFPLCAANLGLFRQTTTTTQCHSQQRRDSEKNKGIVC